MTDPYGAARPAVVLDGGAFIALERGKPHDGEPGSTPRRRSGPAGHVVRRRRAGLAWGRALKVPVAFLLRKTKVVDLTHAVARTLGRMLGATGTSDPVDAHLVFLARERGWPVLTSDLDDLRAIDPTLVLERI